MRTFSAVSVAATVLAGAALFASVVNAQLDPIVIKVLRRSYTQITHGMLNQHLRANTSSTRQMDPNSSFEVLLINKMSTLMAQPVALRHSQTPSQIQLAVRETYRCCSNLGRMWSVYMLSTLRWIIARV
jgi:hypothetical protein